MKRTNSIIAFAAILGCVYLLAVVQNADAQTKKLEILSSFCQPTISDSLLQMNISFSEGYTFKIDGDGKPINIKRFLGSRLNKDEVISCITNWKASGFPKSTRFTAYFEWRNLYGWTRMKIQTKNFAQTTTLTEDESSEK